MGYDQQLVAEILDLNHTNKISRWENGAALPTLVNAFKLAGLYHVYVEELFYDLMDKTRSEITERAETVLARRQRTSPAISTGQVESVTN